MTQTVTTLVGKSYSTGWKVRMEKTICLACKSLPSLLMNIYMYISIYFNRFIWTSFNICNWFQIHFNILQYIQVSLNMFNLFYIYLPGVLSCYNFSFCVLKCTLQVQRKEEAFKTVRPSFWNPCDMFVERIKGPVVIFNPSPHDDMRYHVVPVVIILAQKSLAFLDSWRELFWTCPNF